MTKRTVRRLPEIKGALMGCFEETDWGAVCEPHEDDTSATTGCVTDSFNHCVFNTIPIRTVSESPYLKEPLNKKINLHVGMQRDRKLMRSVQRV